MFTDFINRIELEDFLKYIFQKVIIENLSISIENIDISDIHITCKTHIVESEDYSDPMNIYYTSYGSYADYSPKVINKYMKYTMDYNDNTAYITFNYFEDHKNQINVELDFVEKLGNIDNPVYYFYDSDRLLDLYKEYKNSNNKNRAITDIIAESINSTYKDNILSNDIVLEVDDDDSLDYISYTGEYIVNSDVKYIFDVTHYRGADTEFNITRLDKERESELSFIKHIE